MEEKHVRILDAPITCCNFAAKTTVIVDFKVRVVTRTALMNSPSVRCVVLLVVSHLGEEEGGNVPSKDHDQGPSFQRALLLLGARTLKRTKREGYGG